MDVVASDPSDPPESRPSRLPAARQPGTATGLRVAFDEPVTLTSRPPEGLYVHIPFCVALCPYCDFVVVAGAAARGPASRLDDLLAALQRELELRTDALEQRFGAAERAPLTSLYLGGGTPSLLSAAQVGRILDAVAARLGIADEAEITLEANPGADEIGDLVGFRAAGVNRLSIGAQSMDAGELRRLGRRHRPDAVVAAVAHARRAGIASVGVDLLTDVPGQSLMSWRSTLGAVLDLDPDHLSVYTLTLDDPDAEGLTGPLGDHLPVRPGARRWRHGARGEQSQDRAAAMELISDELAATRGLARYEIANLARPGHHSRHNLLYWQRRPYLALGPGAHAFDGGLQRSWNAARLDGYVVALRAGRLPPGGSETMSPATALAEAAILGLRLSVGIGSELAGRAELLDALEWARGHGLAEHVAGRTRLTRQGRLLANEVFARLLPAA